MDDALELANYLLLSFKTQKEQEYIEFLWDAFDTNDTHGKYSSENDKRSGYLFEAGSKCSM